MKSLNPKKVFYEDQRTASECKVNKEIDVDSTIRETEEIDNLSILNLWEPQMKADENATSDKCIESKSLNCCKFNIRLAHWRHSGKIFSANFQISKPKLRANRSYLESIKVIFVQKATNFFWTFTETAHAAVKAKCESLYNHAYRLNNDVKYDFVYVETQQKRVKRPPLTKKD